MPKVKLIAVFATCMLLACLLLGFSVDRSGDALCDGLVVNINGDGELHFVTQESIKTYIQDHGHRTVGDSITSIDTHTMEEDLALIPYLDDVQVFKSIDRKVHVSVHQRRPVMRMLFTNGRARYVDERGEFIPVAEHFSYKCLPVTGFDSLPDVQVLADVRSNPYLQEVWKMAGYIQNDAFWSAQFIQADYDTEYGIVLIPRVGNHQILLGEPYEFNEKLNDLRAFYDKGIEQTNWNIYESLDLRYEDQVVGIKR